MSKATRIGAKGSEGKEFPCDWYPVGDHKHPQSKKPFDNRKLGNTERGNLGNWQRPHEIFDDPNTPTKRIRYTAYWGKIETRATWYPAQKHHVIPVQSMNAVTALAKNVALLGYDINKEANGMRLPMFDQDIFWHDLPRHCGWNAAHSAYNSRVKTELTEKYNSEWKDLCKEDAESELLKELQEYTNRLKNMIVRWNPSYYVFVNGGDRSSSYDNAGLAPGPINRTRKFNSPD